jgi:thiamine biosynthesis lipoprotein
VSRIVGRLVEHCMGTVFSLDLRAPGAAEDTLTRLIAWLHDMDAMFSTYRASSWINRLDRGDVRLADCPDVVVEVIDACKALRTDTEGWFDHYARGRLDPSGYVKGWAIEQISDRLESAGSTNHCINGGGDVQCIGRPAPDRDWRIGVVHPFHAEHTVATVSGQRLAVATSGSAQRGAHIINPITRQAADTWASVTVVGTGIAQADAWATAAAAVGHRAPRWLTDHHLSGVLVTSSGNCVMIDGARNRERGATRIHRVNASQ